MIFHLKKKLLFTLPKKHLSLIYNRKTRHGGNGLDAKKAMGRCCKSFFLKTRMDQKKRKNIAHNVLLESNVLTPRAEDVSRKGFGAANCLVKEGLWDTLSDVGVQQADKPNNNLMNVMI